VTDLQGVWQRGTQSGRTALNHLADQFEVVNESSCLPGQLIINRTKSFLVWFGSFLEINLIHRTICRFNMNLQPCHNVTVPLVRNRALLASRRRTCSSSLEVTTWRSQSGERTFRRSRLGPAPMSTTTPNATRDSLSKSSDATMR